MTFANIFHKFTAVCLKNMEITLVKHCIQIRKMALFLLFKLNNLATIYFNCIRLESKDKSNKVLKMV